MERDAAIKLIQQLRQHGVQEDGGMMVTDPRVFDEGVDLLPLGRR